MARSTVNSTSAQRRSETWTVLKDRKRSATPSNMVQVQKFVVRVPAGGKGPNGQRPGTFNGITNVRSAHISPA